MEVYTWSYYYDFVVLPYESALRHDAPGICIFAKRRDDKDWDLLHVTYTNGQLGKHLDSTEGQSDWQSAVSKGATHVHFWKNTTDNECHYAVNVIGNQYLGVQVGQP